MINVWMNHWFSTAFNIIELLRADGFEINVIGSNENEHSVIKMFAMNGIRNQF